MHILNEIIKERFLIIDGAMGTQIQNATIAPEAWGENEGCNELLNATAPNVILNIQKAYCEAGADIIKTNTFGAMDWVLDEYGLGERAYELAHKGALIAKEAAKIDGAGPLRTFFSVILPQAVPAIVAVTLFHFFFCWNDFFDNFAKAYFTCS